METWTRSPTFQNVMVGFCICAYTLSSVSGAPGKAAVDWATLLTADCQSVTELNCAWFFSPWWMWSSWPRLCSSTISSSQSPIVSSGSKEPVREKGSPFSSTSSREHLCSASRLFSTKGLPWPTTTSIPRLAFLKNSYMCQHLSVLFFSFAFCCSDKHWPEPGEKD